MNAWYFEAPDGRRFNWNKEPTFTCPLSEPVKPIKDVDGGGWTEPSAELVAAAAALGVAPLNLGQMLRRQHSSHLYGRARIDGKLTDRCAICGHKMDRLGFRCWVDVPITDGDEHEGEASSKAIAGRLGLAEPRRTVHSFYADTKREADAWARDELRTANAVAEEAQR